ncbi:hypothetical protein G3M48_004563 [Beauveria asiatica]|uniref:Secreted protein n=1 Tax=Beauveria asiatica TaxID=1069075 RepID=A0AAW0S9U6_9HYPO
MHVLLFTIYALILFVVINKRAGFTTGGGAAPAAPVLRWEAQKFILEERIQEKGSLSGKPNTHLDEGWHDLFNCQSSESFKKSTA